MDCGVADSYVVALDTELSLMSAWKSGSPNVSYHGGSNHVGISQYLNSDGTCTPSAPTPTPTPPTDAACTTSISDGGNLIGYYDTGLEKVVVQATLPDSSYAGWGWGASMTNTEMLIFSANGASSSVTTYYSEGE